MSDEPAASRPPLEQTLKRCRPEVIEAAKRYQATKDSVELPTIVIGVLERFMEPERRVILAGSVAVATQKDLQLQADLGMDSLVMVEVVMTLEDVLGQQIPDAELQGLVTIGDTLAYVLAKSSGAPLPVPPERLMNELVPMLLGEGREAQIRTVILREGSALATYTGSAASDPLALLAAAGQLAEIFAKRKEIELAALNPQLAEKVTEIDTLKTVQLLIERDGNGWRAYTLQTGTPKLPLGAL